MSLWIFSYHTPHHSPLLPHPSEPVWAAGLWWLHAKLQRQLMIHSFTCAMKHLLLPWETSIHSCNRERWLICIMSLNRRKSLSWQHLWEDSAHWRCTLNQLHTETLMAQTVCVHSSQPSLHSCCVWLMHKDTHPIKSGEINIPHSFISSFPLSLCLSPWLPDHVFWKE